MENRIQELIEQFEKENSENRIKLLNEMYQPLCIITGYYHACESLKRLEGMSYDAMILNTKLLEKEGSFPVISPISILDSKKVWHQHRGDKRLHADNILDLLNPINAWAHAWSPYYSLDREHHLKEWEEPLKTNITSFFRQRNEKMWDFFSENIRGRIVEKKLDDGSNRYLEDSTFLHSAVALSRTIMEGIYANRQAYLDYETILLAAVKDRRLPSNVLSKVETTRPKFITGMIRQFYGPIVCSIVPGESNPSELEYVDKEVLLKQIGH